MKLPFADRVDDELRLLRREAQRHRPRAARLLVAATQEAAVPVFKNFDPPPWWYPVRRSVAAAQLQAGNPALGAVFQGGDVFCRELEPHDLVKKFGGFGEGETQVGDAQFGQLIAGT